MCKGEAEDRSAKNRSRQTVSRLSERTVSQGISDSYLRWQGINRHPGARSVAKCQNRWRSVPARTVCLSFSVMSMLHSCPDKVPAGGPKPPTAGAPGAIGRGQRRVRPSPNVGGTSRRTAIDERRIRGRRRWPRPAPPATGRRPGLRDPAKVRLSRQVHPLRTRIVGSGPLSQIYGVVAPPRSGPVPEKGTRSNP